ncbi:MAG: PRC-barrel domain-containing protein [Candidatus Woesearchaeota archaeon]
MEVFVEKASAVDETLRIQDILGKRVLTKSGAVLGRVKAVHFNKKKYYVEGIVVRKFFKEDKYICITYVNVMTPQAVILSIEPATLFEGCTVVSHDGKKVGTAIKVHRVSETNRVASLTVSRGWFRTMEVRHADIEHLGTSIILSKTYEQLKRDRKSQH